MRRDTDKQFYVLFQEMQNYITNEDSFGLILGYGIPAGLMPVVVEQDQPDKITRMDEMNNVYGTLEETIRICQSSDYFSALEKHRKYFDPIMTRYLETGMIETQSKLGISIMQAVSLAGKGYPDILKRSGIKLKDLVLKEGYKTDRRNYFKKDHYAIGDCFVKAVLKTVK
jgi:hypothetical protein